MFFCFFFFFLGPFFFAVLGLAASLAVWTGQYLTKVPSGRTGHFERVKARCEMSMKCQEAAANVQRTASLGPYCCEAYRRIGCRPPIGQTKRPALWPNVQNIEIEETTWQRDQLLEPKRDSENHLLLWSLQKDCRPPISDKVWPG